MNKGILFGIFALLFLPDFLLAQTRKEERTFLSMATYYETGQYKTGLARLKEYERDPHLSVDPYYATALQAYEALIYAALGKFDRYESSLARSIQTFKTAASEDPAYRIKAQRLIAEAFATIGKYEKADSMLLTIERSDRYTLAEETLRLRYLHYYYLYQQGYFNRINDSLNILIDNAQKRIVSKDSIISKNGKMKFGKLSQYDLLNRKELYARSVLLQIETVFARGKIDSALVLLRKHSEWIIKNMGYKNGVLAKAYLLQGLIASEEDDLKEAERYFNKASGAAANFYQVNAPEYIEIQKQIIQNLLRQSRFEEATIISNDLDVKILSFYGRNSLAYLDNNLIDVDREIAAHSWKKAARHLEEYLEETSLPAVHLSRLQALAKIYQVYLNINDLDKAEQILIESRTLSAALYGPNAPVHHLHLLHHADFLTEYTDHYQEAEDIYNHSFNKVIKTELPHGNRNFYKNNYGEARLYEVLERYDQAYGLFKELLLDAEKTSGLNSIPYAIVLENYANLDITAGQYRQAEEKLYTSLHLYEAFPQNKYLADKLHAWKTYLRLMIMEGKFEEASSVLITIRRLIRNTNESEAQLYASVEEIALLNIYMGKFQQTANNLDELIRYREKHFGINHRALINPLLYKGYLKLVTGDYNEAEANFSRASTIAGNLFGEKSLKYAECLAYYKKLYTAIGDYEKAEKAIQNVVDIQTNQFGPDHISVGKDLHELALAKYYSSVSKAGVIKTSLGTVTIDNGTMRGIDSGREKKKKAKEAQEAKRLETIEGMFNRSFEIIRYELGESNPDYALALENGALYEMYTGNYEKAYQNIEKAKEIWTYCLGKENANSARAFTIAGNLQYLKGNYAEALKEFEHSRATYQSIFGDDHPGYIEAQGRCAQMYYILGDIKNSVASAEEAVEKSLAYLDHVFPSLSERGKENYWDKVKNDFEFYKTLAFTQYEEYPEMIGTVFDITLRTKAILLNSSLKVKQKILSSGDSTLISHYERWLLLKDDLSAALSMQAEQRKEARIDLGEMENKIEALEKRLSLSSELFARNYDNKTEYKWTELKRALKENEVVIEIVPFRFFHKKFTDTVWYALLAVTEETRSTPEFVVIRNGYDLQNRYMQYYRNCIRFQIPDEESYNAYWQKIIPLIKNEETTIYLSPDGVYNQLNPETIRTPDGDYLINRNKIILIGSSRDLIDRNRSQSSRKARPNPVSSTADVALLGNPEYYKAGFSHARTVEQLPGAEMEIKRIKEVLASGRYKTQMFLYKNATEECVKELTNPRIFHIATHGFFMQDSDADEEMLDEVAEKAVQNPLLRSGLLLKNGGQILQEENVYAFNKEDGILTAYEAMNLNFDNTELVVLSACETGLGEVKLGEGVFGLQRSFLVAGSKAIIMSLFKVSDEVTTELMSSFYRKWMAGETKRNAFVEAKKEIMAKYNNPQYWGAFVMIGLE